MAIHRKILKVKTVGSRQTGDLRPELSDTLPSGFNYAVLEYDEAENTCIVECWCSDHPLQEKQRTVADLSEISKNSAVIEVLESHPKSPRVLGVVSTTAFENVDDVKKEITVKGKRGAFLRKERIEAHGENFDSYILDEG